MMFQCIFTGLIVFGFANTALAKPTKKFSRAQVTTQLGVATLDTPLGNFSDPGINLGLNYYFLPKVVLNANYFLTVSSSGSSNFNGFGVQGKYYFWNSETSSELDNDGTKIIIFDKYFGYGSLGFYNRDIRTSQLTVSYSGFGVGLGGGIKLNAKNSVGLEVQRANMENPTGAESNGGGSFTYFSVFHSFLF